MDTIVMVAIIIAVVAVAGLAMAWFGAQKRKTDGLRSNFGSEYDRTVGDVGDRRRAEQELKSRQERVQRLHIKPLSHDQVQTYAAEWREVQARFVDDPKAALHEADELVGQVMEKRGYPVGDFEQQAADVSVDHADVVTNYRTAHRISKASDDGGATTEEMRQAMHHYRALFDDLLQTAEARR